ncbi:MAG: hypothetical protein IJM13_09730 [Lachnospiraceae bacterium]|nr:hypothetical protein [Lachnospiraceae bacterium]MBQ1514360.1 hypothetical protein [Lachnospiraceae bacterium]MBR0107473.1 hypothetical protein [Lachnospiraceae bacterium]MBR0402916.1 hypothetical protein [Lachnospiraceae bacterium]MBR2738460.1 hypothetical protein [Lachnospiraceae bacterium]
MNPMKLLALKGRVDVFRNDHPNVIAFLNGAQKYVEEGSVIEMRITMPDGRKAATNFVVNANDMQTIAGLKEAL